MRTMIAFVLLLVSTVAGACECVHEEFDPELARSAETALLFRVVATRLDPAAPEEAMAEIEVDRVLRGDARVPKTARYYVGWCCGIGLNVGTYYFGFGTVKNGEIRVHQGNLIELWPGVFSISQPEQEIAEVEAMLAGIAEIPQNIIDSSRRGLGGMCRIANPEEPDRAGAR